MTTTNPTHPGSDYRDRLPAMLRETFTGPHGEPCFTTTDRRWLWHLEGFLAVSATTPEQRQVAADLQMYLRETCEHHWRESPADPVYEIAAHRQCLWCNDIQDVQP